MQNIARREPLDRGIEAAWERVLAQVPNQLGQLIYLSSLRDPQTAKYEHHGLIERYGEEAAQETILYSHRQVFRDWIDQGLSVQKRVLVEYLSGTGEPLADVTHRWLSVSFFRPWMPVDTPDYQQSLYLTDFETLLGLIHREAEAAGLRPTSSPAQ